MGDELLKKTGAGNLFMVFGEPDGKQEAEERADSRRDQGRGCLRSNHWPDSSASTDDIACWFIDADYNGESFFVRHAYFTGADEPYDKLKRALRADINQEAWQSLYSTVSRPVDKPGSAR